MRHEAFQVIANDSSRQSMEKGIEISIKYYTCIFFDTIFSRSYMVTNKIGNTND